MANSNGKIEANLDFSLNVTLPCCDRNIDLIADDQDPDGFLAKSIFTNKWDDAKGFTVFCDQCDLEFEIGEIIY